MTTYKSLRFGAVLCVTGVLAACNSSTPTANMTAPTPATTPATPAATTPATMVATSGMTTTPPAVSNSFITAFEAANDQLVTTTPLSGSADYVGQVEVHTTQDRNDPDNVVYGDLNMTIDFDGAAKPITATATNFAGRIDGEQTQVSGTLSSEGSRGANQVLALPAAGITSTNIAVQLDGTLSDPTGTLTGDARMALAGAAHGPDGASFSGSHSFAVSETGGGSKVNSGGRFYADK